MQNFILIGYGNLAHSMMQGFSQDPFLKSQIFKIYGRNYQKAQAFAQHFSNASAIPSLEDHLTPNSVVILCIKPMGIDTLKYSLPLKLIYSVMAGIPIQTLKNRFPQAQGFAKAMPNIGSSVKKSATSLYVLGDVNLIEIASNLTQAFGTSVLLDREELIDASIATNGSSPAFLSLVAEALIESGVREGIPFEQSKALVASTFEGFAELLKTQTPDSIKTLVTSPAGTTAEGLAYLDRYGFKGILKEASHQSVLKAKGKLH